MRTPSVAGPIALRALVALVVLFFLLPLAGLVVRAPWKEMSATLGSPAILEALRLSLISSFVAALLSFVCGLPLAVWLASGASFTRSAVRALVLLPMVLPPVVGGIALLIAYGRNGIAGPYLENVFGVTLPFSLAAVIVAQTYVAMPFFVLTAEAGLRSFDQRFALAAATLGAGPLRTFRTVTLPMIAPSLYAGIVVAWARALGEFGATITFAGNLAGETRTLPLALFVALENDPDSAIMLSLALVVVSGLVLFSLRKRWFPAR
jgi:molybdate transport system permease protein